LLQAGEHRSGGFPSSGSPSGWQWSPRSTIRTGNDAFVYVFTPRFGEAHRTFSAPPPTFRIQLIGNETCCAAVLAWLKCVLVSSGIREYLSPAFHGLFDSVLELLTAKSFLDLS